MGALLVPETSATFKQLTRLTERENLIKNTEALIDTSK
jgi:hypothetical protein